MGVKDIGWKESASGVQLEKDSSRTLSWSDRNILLVSGGSCRPIYIFGCMYVGIGCGMALRSLHRCKADAFLSWNFFLFLSSRLSLLERDLLFVNVIVRERLSSGPSTAEVLDYANTQERWKRKEEQLEGLRKERERKIEYEAHASNSRYDPILEMDPRALPSQDRLEKRLFILKLVLYIVTLSLSLPLLFGEPREKLMERVGLR